MNWTRAQLKKNAQSMVKKNWLYCVLISFVMTLIGGREGIRFQFSFRESDMYEQGMDQMMMQVGGEWVHWFRMLLPFFAGTMLLILCASIAIAAFLGGPLRVGGCRFYLHNIHSTGEPEDLMFAFRNQYQNVVVVMLIRAVKTALWTLLLVIPGIIKAYEYRLVPYLLADNPELTADQAISESRRMMDGEKMNAFVLDLSFILWNIASALTMGIVGVLWVNPYQDAANAELYTAIQTRMQGEGSVLY